MNLQEQIKKLINDYWRFDDNQRPTSSWHEKQDLLKEIDKLFPTEAERHYSAKEVLEIIAKSFQAGENWGVTYSTWFNPEAEYTERKIKEVIDVLSKEYGIKL
jgi:hypothetical protein